MEAKNKRPIVLVVESLFNRFRELFEPITDLDIRPAPVAEASLSQEILEQDPVAVVLDVDAYTDSLYKAMKKGRLIARFGVGCDGIDFAKARKNELKVTNTPDVLESTVAEFTVFLAGEVLRKVGLSSGKMKNGNWNRVIGRELHGKTCAIIGLGNIGKRVSQILTFGFGNEVLALKRTIEDRQLLKEKYGVAKVSTEFSEIAPLADIVSLHLPANEETYHYLDKSRLQSLKQGAVLINTGRGALIDECALYDALDRDHLAGAGLDVFAHEPYRPVDPAKDLRKLDNVVLTPHIGSSTLECTKRMAERVIQNIRYSIKGKHQKMDIVMG